MHAIPSSERGEAVCRRWFRFMPNTNEVPLVPDKETQYLGLPREKGSQMEMGHEAWKPSNHMVSASQYPHSILNVDPRLQPWDDPTQKMSSAEHVFQLVDQPRLR